MCIRDSKNFTQNFHSNKFSPQKKCSLKKCSPNKFPPKKKFTQKKFRTKIFCTESVRLSFVDLRWAQLYVSLVAAASWNRSDTKEQGEKTDEDGSSCPHLDSFWQSRFWMLVFHELLALFNPAYFGPFKIQGEGADQPPIFFLFSWTRGWSDLLKIGWH